MERPGPIDAEQAARGLHTRVSSAIMLVVLVTCLVMSLLANSPQVTSWIRRTSWELARETGTIFSQSDQLIDFEDRLIHVEIPEADYSRGGVYFLGQSNLKWGFTTWDLPPEYRSRIHNFGIGSTSSKQHLRLLRFLVEEEGLLRAGGDKTLVVLAASYFSVAHATNFFDSIWGRHAFYTVESDETIRRTNANRRLARLRLELVKIPGIAKEMFGIARLWCYKLRLDRGLARDRVATLRDASAHTEYLMRANWRERIAQEIDDLARTLDYLRERNASRAVLLLPYGSWEDRLPYERAFDAAIRELCTSKDVRLYDFSSLLDDEDFADRLHFTPTGMEKFRDAIMPICLEHLRSAGALPQTP